MGLATGAKRERAVGKAMATQPVESLLSLDSGLRTFNINFDRFLQPFRGDPLDLDGEYLKGMDLLDVPAIVFLSDREGSQHLGFHILWACLELVCVRVCPHVDYVNVYT